MRRGCCGRRPWRGWWATRGIQPPRAGRCQRRPSLSKEGSFLSSSLTYVALYSATIPSLLLLGLVLCLSGCQENQPISAEQKTENTALRKVQTTRLAKVPMERIITVSGTLAAYDQVTLRAKVPGRLGTLPVDLGSVVRRGETVAQVETEDYELRLQQSQAALGQVRARLGLPLEGESDRFEIETTGPVRQAKAMLEDARVKMERAQSLMGQGLIPRRRWKPPRSVTRWLFRAIKTPSKRSIIVRHCWLSAALSWPWPSSSYPIPASWRRLTESFRNARPA